MRNKTVLFLCPEFGATREILLYDWLLKGGKIENYETIDLEYEITQDEDEVDGFVEIRNKPVTLPKHKITNCTELCIFGHGSRESSTHFFESESNGNSTISVDELAKYIETIIDKSKVGTASCPLTIDLVTGYGAYSSDGKKPSLAENLLFMLAALNIQAKIIARKTSVIVHGVFPVFVRKGGITVVSQSDHEASITLDQQYKKTSRYNLFAQIGLAFTYIKLHYQSNSDKKTDYLFEINTIGDEKRIVETRIIVDTKSRTLKELAAKIISDNFMIALQEGNMITAIDYAVKAPKYFNLAAELVQDIALLDDDAPQLLDTIKFYLSDLIDTLSKPPESTSLLFFKDPFRKMLENKMRLSAQKINNISSWQWQSKSNKEQPQANDTKTIVLKARDENRLRFKMFQAREALKLYGQYDELYVRPWTHF